MSGRSIPYGRRDTASAGCEPTSPGLLDGVNERLDRLEYASVVDKSHIGQLQQRIAHLERQVDALLLRQVGSPSPRTRRPGEKLPGRKR